MRMWHLGWDGRMLSSGWGQGVGSVGRKRLWAEGALSAFIHSTDIYEVCMCVGIVLSIVVHDEQDISDFKEHAVWWGRKILVIAWATFTAGRGKSFPTRGNSMCKDQESRTQDIWVGGWGFLAPLVDCCVGCCLAHHLALLYLRTKLLSLPMEAMLPEKKPPQQMLMRAFCSEMEVAGLGWLVPPSPPPQAGSMQSSAPWGWLLKTGAFLALLLPACLSQAPWPHPRPIQICRLRVRVPSRRKPPSCLITFSLCLSN